VQPSQQLITLPDEGQRILPLFVDEGPTGGLRAEDIVKQVIGMILAPKRLSVLPIGNDGIVVDKVE